MQSNLNIAVIVHVSSYVVCYNSYSHVRQLLLTQTSSKPHTVTHPPPPLAHGIMGCYVTGCVYVFVYNMVHVGKSSPACKATYGMTIIIIIGD